MTTIAPELYTLRYETETGAVTRQPLTATQVTRAGKRVADMGAKGTAWDIAVLDRLGDDVTDTFDCFY